MKTYDLRSDFLSPATPEMLRAMAEAAAAPSGFGLREAPEQRALERRVADLLGKADALLMPTCTMANLVAVAAQIAPGEMVVAEARSHCVLSEAGGIAAVAGGLVMALPGRGGVMDRDALTELLERGADAQRPRVALVVAETTHNRAGGVPLPLPHLERLGELAARHGAALHVDGARFLNASVALGVPPAEMARPAATVSLSLNKGPGAPSGAVLAGPASVIERAVILRQRFGGGMRPAGAIAAAGLEALRGYEARLGQDHANCARLAGMLSQSGMDLRPKGQLTNILMLRSADRAGQGDAAGRLARRGVLGLDFGEGWVRLCLHAGIASADIPQIAAAIRDAMQGDNGT